MSGAHITVFQYFEEEKRGKEGWKRKGKKSEQVLKRGRGQGREEAKKEREEHMHSIYP